MRRSVDQDLSMATPPDMQQLSPTTTDSNPSPILQITPKSKHASSGFHYPAMLSDYGVSEAEWDLFTSQFIAANAPSRYQLIAMSTFTLGFEIFFLASGVGIFSLPFVTLTAVAIGNLPLYFIFKKHNLRRHIRNGRIPEWIDAYNEKFFGPKGLRLAFELPGTKLPYTDVAPKRRVTTMALGEFKEPMKAKEAAKRARIVVVEAGEPSPEAGTLPGLVPMKTSKMYQMMKQGSVQWTVNRIKVYKAKTVEVRRQRQLLELARLQGIDPEDLRMETEA